LDQSKNALERLNEFAKKFKNSKEKDDLKLIEKTKEKFKKAMDDDFDCSKAFQVIFDFVKKVNKSGGSKKSYEFVKDIDRIFNVLSLEEISIPAKIKELSDEREKARHKKNFKKADEIRKKIKDMGYILEDTDGKTIIKKI
jgi:cysteinyl-tRNA synthetase